MMNFQIFSAQTGATFGFGTVEAASERDALDVFARECGYGDARAMWAAGHFEYIDARVAS